MSGNAVSWSTMECDFGSLIGECQLAGIQLADDRALTVPAVVVGLVVVVIAFFLYSTARLLWRHVRYQRRLRGLVKTLATERTSPAILDRAKLNRVGEKLGADDLFQHGWREFQETIVSESSGDDERIYNTRQAEEFFSEEAVVDESMDPAFFRSVPGVLTSLGLLGTFLAILLGLAVIQVPETADGSTGSIEGIESFVNALSGKFLSSVVALMFAIVFTLLETRVLRQAHQTYRAFCQSFDAVFPRRTAEEVLMAMNLEIQGQRAAFEHFNTDLSARFRDGVTEGLGPVLERIVQGLDSITGERDSNIEALLERLTAEFRQAMTQSAGVEFDQIASAMNNASELINQANEQSAAGRESFEALVSAMEESRVKQSEIASQQGATLNSILERMVETVSKTSEASRSAVDATVRDLVERTSQESRESAAALRVTLEQYSEGMKEQVDGLCERVEKAAAGIEAAGVSGSRDLSESIKMVTDRLEQSTGRVLEKTDATNSQIATELSRLFGEHRGSASSLMDAREALEKTLVVWNEGSQQMRTIVAPLSEASQRLDSVSSHVAAMLDDVGRAQRSAGELVGQAQSELEKIAQMETSSARLLEEHQRVFQTVQSGLAGTLDVLSEKLETIQSVTARGLTGQLQEFDNHLGTATQKLGSAVDDLGEALDAAAERIAGAGPQ